MSPALPTAHWHQGPRRHQLGATLEQSRGLRLGGGAEKEDGVWPDASVTEQRERSPSTILPFSPCPPTVLTGEEGPLWSQVDMTPVFSLQNPPGVQAEFVPGP